MECQDNRSSSLLEKRDESSILSLEIETNEKKNFLENKKIKTESKSSSPEKQFPKQQYLILDAGISDFSKEIDLENDENNLVFNLSKNDFLGLNVFYNFSNSCLTSLYFCEFLSGSHFWLITWFCS